MSSDATTDKDAAQTIIDFLKQNVPRSDQCNIQSELKKDFVFAKKKSKTRNKKADKKKARCLTRSDKKLLGFYTIPRNSVKFKDVLPMHAIWTDYMNQILDLSKPIPNSSSKGWDSFTQSLYKSDFHGSMLHVVRSKCPSYVGKRGICIMDTRNTFKIVSQDDLVTTLPKKECVFQISVKSINITVFGKHLCVRPAERSTKKIKCQLHPDLV